MGLKNNGKPKPKDFKMKIFTCNLLGLEGLSDTAGGFVGRGLQTITSKRGLVTPLGQYDRQSVLRYACVDQRNPAKVEKNGVILEGFPLSFDERIFIALPAHQHPSILVRIITKTEREFGLTLGNIDEGGEIVGGGHGFSGPAKKRWDDVLVTLPRLKSAEIVNGSVKFRVINNGGEAIIVTEGDYQTFFRPHIEVTETDQVAKIKQAIVAPPEPNNDDELMMLAESASGRNRGTRKEHRAALASNGN